jgi:exosortase A-associated hydrolase 1
MTGQSWNEHPIVFDCEGDRLLGIVTLPEEPIKTGVVIVVGGPQYRAGSHRQFTLLARHLAREGIASFRFDYRGMGDSEGDVRGFEVVDADIRSAINAFLGHASGVTNIALWGLCDAASAALIYGHTDSRVKRMILLNPWVHTEQGAARVQIKFYYLKRLLQLAFWAKLFSGRLELKAALGDLWSSFRSASNASISGCESNVIGQRHKEPNYIDRMLDGLRAFKHEILLILSGSDLTAKEFSGLVKTDRRWKEALDSPARARQELLTSANHTFSSRGLRDQVEKLTIVCMRKNDF